jgi:hypothetical protein
MKRIGLLILIFTFSAQLIGCGEAAAPPAGAIGKGEGTDNGPPTKGLAAKDRENMLKSMAGKGAAKK